MAVLFLPLPPVLGVQDSTALALVFVALLALHTLQRYLLGPRLSATYRKLPPDIRFDWDQRALNLAFQVAQTAFNCHVLFFSTVIAADPLWGYTVAAHAGFIAITGFYLYDCALFITHPDAELVTFWVCHHLFASGMLIWLTGYQRTSALPASAFLVSASGHVFNEVRWFLRTTRAVNARVWANAVGVACNIVIFATCVVPPPYLVWLASRVRDVPWLDMFTVHMRTQCVLTYFFVWIPHCSIFCLQVRRTLRHWNRDGSFVAKNN